ncbi:sigma-70 family RNA polymerase sigma factor [Cellulomonas wangsupingiae]|uniref:Sigma-70 family RNA polymerase sigma factor n=1 Tax=Cellulomonas wangsupingiae TaxID=2968085 RepID=A0ABY5K7V4_9CELL|nr:sigma-70 family RNA polymerase sigma factor [Cellulomonas wangsupingiae]MCC2333897.1 sigma-70 family RNA polymerase sigma factor [Cellulomonas wangsupingiae]MCM0639275.1 sigma-70 family RNA polymerase sigma factor [Cellulomonas wangsupingiae]UUI65155.1 sigma-70 family RNA polymerase sigma factor [Cellulomonas wangsupingiae]
MTRSDDVLDELVRVRYPALLARARMLVRDPAAAQDLVQDALVATFVGRARFGSVPAAEQYVRRALATRYVDGLRRGGRERAGAARLAALPVAAAPDPAEASTALADDVERALATLAPRERACVVLRHLEDLSVHETAVLLRLSDGAVKRYTADGVRALQALLGVRAPDPERAGVRVRLVPTEEESRG